MRTVCIVAGCFAASSMASVVDSTEKAYTEYVVGQYAARQQGNVGVVAMTSGGDYAAAAAPSASIQFSRTTVFEVGSTTKTFSTLALELLAGQGKLSMTDTLGMHLGAKVTLSPLVASMTLKELATHTSGLERMPANEPQSADSMHAYLDTDMYAYLSGLTRSCTSAQDTNCVGPKKFLYSNTGFGLIGWITCLVSGKGWEALIKELILAPLAMSDTAVALSTDQQSRLAPPSANGGQPSGPTTFTDVMVGAGGLRSTAVDMLQYTKAFAGLVDVSKDMRAAMDRMLQPYAADEFPNLKGQVDEAFQQYTLRKETVHWKDGATNGYNCYMSFLPGKSAAIVLANTAPDSPDASTVLAANLILAGPPPQRTRFDVPWPVMQSYAGRYTQAPDPGSQAQSVHYTVQANPQYPALVIQSDANPTVEVLPFQQDAFFAQGVEAYMQEGSLLMLYSGQDHYATKSYMSENSNASMSVEREVMIV